MSYSLLSLRGFGAEQFTPILCCCSFLPSAPICIRFTLNPPSHVTIVEPFPFLSESRSRSLSDEDPSLRWLSGSGNRDSDIELHPRFPNVRRVKQTNSDYGTLQPASPCSTDSCHCSDPRLFNKRLRRQQRQTIRNMKQIDC